MKIDCLWEKHLSHRFGATVPLANKNSLIAYPCPVISESKLIRPLQFEQLFYITQATIKIRFVDQCIMCIYVFAAPHDRVQHELRAARALHVRDEIQRAADRHIRRRRILAEAASALQIGAGAQHNVRTGATVILA